MSAAFRNFILTLIIMLAVFGYTALKILPDIEEVLFFENTSSEESSEAVSEVSVSESSGDETSAETSQPEKDEYDTFSCVFASKNEAGDICSLLYVEILEETQTYITCRIPVDVYLDDSGVPKLLYELLGENDTDYLLKKVSPLIGKDVVYYVVCDGDTYKAAASAAEKANAAINIDLTYAVTYLDPDFADIVNSEDITDEYYITLPVGSTALTETNAGFIFNSGEGDVKNYTFQESMGIAVFKQLSSISGFASNIEVLTALYNSVQTNVPISELSRYASLIFAYSSYSNTHITYPTTNDYSSTDMKTPDWSSGISQIKSAEG